MPQPAAAPQLDRGQMISDTLWWAKEVATLPLTPRLLAELEHDLIPRQIDTFLEFSAAAEALQASERALEERLAAAGALPEYRAYKEAQIAYQAAFATNPVLRDAVNEFAPFIPDLDSAAVWSDPVGAVDPAALRTLEERTGGIPEVVALKAATDALNRLAGPILEAERESDGVVVARATSAWRTCVEAEAAVTAAIGYRAPEAPAVPEGGLEVA